MSNDLVAYSRAGDVFHYRWAARRCLRLLYPNASIRSIVIEGSKENKKEGEYVIDVSEYYELTDDKKQIRYYQLKHTTVQKDSPFTLSDLKDTLEGFAKRYNQHLKEDDAIDVSFVLVTNRPVTKFFKDKVLLLAEGKTVSKGFLKTITAYTRLSSSELSKFCGLLDFEDGEGDYDSQKDELRFEISQLTAGTVDNAQIENIVSLVQEKILPKSDRVITREDILKRFNIFSERDLFPAPAIWEEKVEVIGREQYGELMEAISLSSYSFIVHAPGGVGKSMFCRQLSASLPSNSFALAYDCFGAGQYRNRSEPRHRHRDALVQIANELAVKGLCDPLIVQDTSQDSDIMRKFLWRLEASVKNLRHRDDSALLFILIDAADNAEMAAQEYSTPCFASELLRETMPEGCRLVLLCRTERIALLKPNSKIKTLELKPFSKGETLLNLRRWFEDADEKDGEEFHRLTSGNPRVQANALSVKATSVLELLGRLGPLGTTVEQQIEQQLHSAVSTLKDSLSASFQEQIDAVCLGLASLPPHIPVKILAEAAGVSIETIKSFTADIGRSLWLSDDSVQFRDEPSETWFRKTFLAEKKNFETYIKLLEPLAGDHTYVSEVLPHLYLQAGQYEKLIQTALSDSYLPLDNPIDARSVRIYRLQFAFRAAVREAKYKDAIKIAVRAGEEMAGNQRQISLFHGNIDLLTALQDKQKVQDIAFKRLLCGGWNGSENIYTASLLSGINEYKGEARGYLRAGVNWMVIYFEELKKSKDDHPQNEVTDENVLEMASAYFNIYGVKECIEFLNRFTSKILVFKVVGNLAKRFIDAGNLTVVEKLLQACIDEPYYTVAITDELVNTGHFPEKEQLENCLELLVKARTRIKIPENYYQNENLNDAILSFLEACLHRNLPKSKLLKVLQHYTPEKATRMVYDGHQWHERNVYLKALALRMMLQEKSDLDIDSILPDDLAEKKKKNQYERDDEIKKLREVIGGLFPWYQLRTLILSGQDFDFEAQVRKADENSKKATAGRHRSYDSIPNEISSQRSSILKLYSNGKKEEVQWFYESYLKNNKSLWIPDELQNVRAAFRLEHLDFLKQEVEQRAYKRIKSITEGQPETAAERYISLARAVLNKAPDDAAVYFEEAVDIVSKFGDEIVRRWEAVVSLAERSCSEKGSPDLAAYRFIRCAEVVGEYVDREKHWDRSDAIAVCARMSSGTAIAALSRWRDRHIGRFEFQLEALLTELVKSDTISAAAGWALTRFLSSHQHGEFLSLCLGKEPNAEIKDKIFADSVRLLESVGTSPEFWERIKAIGYDGNIKNDTVEKISAYHKKNKKEPLAEIEKKPINEAGQNLNDFPWNDVFEVRDIFEAEDFQKCLESFYSISDKRFYRNVESFWEQIVLRLSEKSLWKFIEMLLSSELSHYQIKSFFQSLPDVWKNKISYKKKWPLLIRELGKKYAQELTSPYSIKYFIGEFSFDNSEIDKLKEGIFEGLAGTYEFSDAQTFFGFVDMTAPLIKPEEAAELLDFALSRFELHIEEDFGDGQWSEWLSVPEDINNQLAGFIWSALGSPRSSERWSAAHCVRLLAEFDCIEIIEELFKWMQHDKTDAFGCAEFPFYNLHARLYMLIASARISVERAGLLFPFKDVFVRYALGDPHALIQKFAADAAINLSSFSHDIYDIQTLEKIKMTGKSNMPVVKMNYNDTVESYWHVKDEIATDYDFDFSYDFDRYWFDPLGDVFGISGKQVEDIAADVIIRQWGLEKQTGWNNDPRADLWNRHSDDRETWHDHSGYPKTDNLDFYLSYHSMMAAAAKLLEKMPIVEKNDWYEDVWDEWISRHLLTCIDGKWLSDYRGAVPLERPGWISETKNDNWREDISEESFYRTLKTEGANGDVWLNVRGGWEEKHSERIETVSIASALVSRNASDALMRALQTCSDPNDFKLPDYEEERMEIRSNPFELKGWIKKDYGSKRLDEYDPYAENVDYPPYRIGSDVAAKLNLSLENDGKSWFLPLSSNPDVECEIWSTYSMERDQTPDQSGSRVKASLKFLKELCTVFNCDLILEVSIKRDISYRYRSREEKYEYLKPINKLFILSSDGELRTTTTNHKPG
ncbi:hypothetical protein [Flavobacterium johnsoniae]|nr:hypothetical protein [Flavobacterium johnsoniae]OXE99787.1 hypothetical protein B0A63_10810 [Flavobacterium johnsoniae UW101]WQG82301.1 hypothetical protein SR927_04110 [Flavobacterium johnsoniae UW101]SHK79124.1 hypothetical protein SAMN05444146_2285 [Flavobacterium johnsoniae]